MRNYSWREAESIRLNVLMPSWLKLGGEMNHRYNSAMKINTEMIIRLDSRALCH